VALAVSNLARAALGKGESTLIAEIDGAPPESHLLTQWLVAVGFLPGAMGLQFTRRSAASFTADVDLH
jgi:hypothetical protein